mgnify:CR=1 FL=1
MVLVLNLVNHVTAVVEKRLVHAVWQSKVVLVAQEKKPENVVFVINK